MSLYACIELLDNLLQDCIFAIRGALGDNI